MIHSERSPNPGGEDPLSETRAQTNGALVVCTNLVKIYQVDELEVVALQGLDLEIQPGELMAIIGASGSGKSTLLNILGGLDRPSAGTIRVAGRNLLKAPDRELEAYRLRDVGFVWQQSSRNLLPYLTAQENVELPMVAAGLPEAQRAAYAWELLDAVGLSDRKEHRLHQLSGGQQQRIAIAVALANRPQLLLADEPTGEVDSTTAQQIWQVLRSLNQRFGLTIVIVSHDRNIAQVVDRVIGIRDGKTSTETVWQSRQDPDPAGMNDPGLAAGQPAHAPAHLEERVVLDSAGRLQMPRDYLAQRGIGSRALVQLVAEGILVRAVADSPAVGAEKDSTHLAGRTPIETDPTQDPTPLRNGRWWGNWGRRLFPGLADRRPREQWASPTVDGGIVQGIPIHPPSPRVEGQNDRPVVQVTGLRRDYPVGDQVVHALQGIDLQIEPGSFTIFQGRSGSGKTTLLNLIGGLDTPNSGQITLLGQDLQAFSENERAQLRQDRLGFVFQAFSLVPTFSALENVELALWVKKLSAERRRQRARYCLSLVGLAPWADHRPFELSGGQQQRISIARAVAGAPQILIADEPTSDLDSETGRQILQLFARLVAEEGMTLLMASHDPASLEFASHVYELEDGRIVNQAAADIFGM